VSVARLPISEAQFQRTVIELAERFRWKVAHFHDSRRQVKPGVWIGDSQAAGWPDLVLVRARQLLVVELKTEDGKLTEAQKEWIRVLRYAGAECHVWRPSDWDEIEARLR